MSNYFCSSTIIPLPQQISCIKLSKYRPISLSTIIRKIINKLINNRLQDLLRNLIFLNQSAFTKGRYISENLLLAQEILRNLNTKCKGGIVVIKLDLHKAFDTINWCFIQQVLIATGFNSNSTSLIMRIISNYYYLVLVNGAKVGFFRLI